MTTLSSDSPAFRKAALREAALARRDALEIDDRLEWNPAMAEQALAVLAPLFSPHAEEPCSGVSKGGPDGSGTSGSILRGVPGGAPRDEGSEGNVRSPVVSGYWPMRSEADPRPILEGLHERGLPLCLPVIVEKRMIFRRWAPYEPIVPGGFGTLVPEPRQPQVSPTILIVPLAAFDRRGYRIGYGKGYYDRALAELGPTLSIGIGYATQEIEAVPYEPHDQRLDWIVTERETIRCG